MTAKQFQNLLKKKHRAIIGAQFCFLIAFAVVIGNQHNALTARDRKAQQVQQSLHDISQWHRAEYGARYEAVAHSLLLLDAYERGGVEKWQEVFDGYEKKFIEADEYKEKIRLELEKYGVIVAPYYDPADFPTDPPPVSLLN